MSQGAAGPVWGGREGVGYWGERGLYWGTTLARVGVRGGPVPAGQVPEGWDQAGSVGARAGASAVA